MSLTIETSSEILLPSLAFFKVEMIFYGSAANPIQLPLNMIFVFSFISSIFEFRLNSSQPILNKMFLIWSFMVYCRPIVTLAISAKFFTIPIFCPSGVSDGQIIPKWVLCKRRGLADFELDWIGATTLLKCDNVAKKLVSLLSTCATPDLMTSPVNDLPQFPVARAALKVVVMGLGSKISSICF